MVESPEEATPQPDRSEPAGDQDRSTEKEYEEAKEEAADEAASEAPADPIAAAEEEARRYLELAQRTQAEFENYRKRSARDAAQAGERAKANLIRELLPVLDNLERALATANPEEDPLAEGVRLGHAELVNTPARHGIKS